MGTIFEFVNNLKRKPFIQSIMNDLHGEAFLVGGAARDLVLGKQNKDVDLVIRGVNIDILLNQLKKFGSANIVGKSFGVITFKDNSDGEIYDVALPRTEFANGDGGHKGFDITYDENLPIEKDLIRRDAKFNAIAINLNTNQIIDPHGGLDDIKNKQTSLVNPDAFTDDPLRLLRFVGFTSRNAGFKIAPESMSKIHQTAHRIKEISSERILKEFEKIVEKGSPESGAKLLVETTLYQNIFDTQFKGFFAQFGKVKTLAEFMFLLMNNSIASPAKFYIQHFGDYGSLSKIISAFELTRKEINTPAEERWLINTVNKIDPKAVGSFVVQDKLKDASIHPEEKYPRKATDLAVKGDEINSMGINGAQHGRLNNDLLDLIYNDKLENSRESIIGYIQQNIDTYKSTPHKIREIAAKVLHNKLQQFTIYYRGFHRPIPTNINQALIKASTPEEIEIILSDGEKQIADMLNKDDLDGYLDCDQVADLMSQVLTYKNIQHHIVIGKSDEGSSHAYIKIGEKRYDPTHQGFNDMSNEDIITEDYKGTLIRGVGKNIGSKVENDETVLKESEAPDVYKFQDTHAETLIHQSWNGGGGNQWRYRFENAGDVLRELGKYRNEFLDGNYIFEKINKIESFINAFKDDYKLHYDDRYSTLKIQNEDNLKALRHAYEIQPVVTEAQKVALQLIFNLLDGKLLEAKKQTDYFDQFRDDDGEAKLKIANRYPNQITNTSQINESEGNMDGNFEALVQQVKQRVPSLAKYNEFPEENYDHFQLSKRIGQSDVYWHNQQVTLTNVAIMSEFKMSYRNFNQKKWYNFTLKNQIFFDIPDTFADPMQRFVMQTAFNMLNDKYSYHKELMVPETTTYQQADIDAIINEINRKTFEFEDHVNNFTRTEIFEQVKINGRELSKSEVLELLKQEASEKRLIVKNGDYREGANALHSLSIINRRIRIITLELKIEELSKIQDNERNAQRYDKFDKQIKKLRNELDQLKFPNLQESPLLNEAPQQQFKDSDILKVEKAILAEYGETNVTSCGYISPSGYCIDIRGAAGNDHRNIMGTIENLPINWGLYNGEKYAHSFSKWLYIALDMGFIRVIPESGNIEMRSMPTQDQFTQLRRFFQQKRGESIIDVYGDEQTYLRFEENTPTDMIIEAIKRFFLYGEKPEQYDDSEYWNEQVKRVTKRQLQEAIMESVGKKVKRLVIFDMDSTLINSPMPEFGREEWKQKTGGDFPSEKAWWSVPESLDTNVFEITAIAPVFNQMRDEQRRPDTMVVVMTNRLDTLEREVKRVLRLNRINPDALNMAAYAQQNKGERILQILKENPSIRYVAFYDDQEKNIMDVRNALRKKGITYDLYNCQDGKIRRT